MKKTSTRLIIINNDGPVPSFYNINININMIEVIYLKFSQTSHLSKDTFYLLIKML